MWGGGRKEGKGEKEIKRHPMQCQEGQIYTFNGNVQVPDEGTVGTPDLIAISNHS